MEGRTSKSRPTSGSPDPVVCGWWAPKAKWGPGPGDQAGSSGPGSSPHTETRRVSAGPEHFQSSCPEHGPCDRVSVALELLLQRKAVSGKHISEVPLGKKQLEHHPKAHSGLGVPPVTLWVSPLGFCPPPLVSLPEIIERMTAKGFKSGERVA